MKRVLEIESLGNDVWNLVCLFFLRRGIEGLDEVEKEFEFFDWAWIRIENLANYLSRLAKWNWRSNLLLKMILEDSIF
jgi:hypothetical protein